MTRLHWLLFAVAVLVIGVALVSVFGPVSGIAGAAAGAVGWLLGGWRRPDTAAANDRAARAAREAQLELDAAVARGLAHRDDVDARAGREVDHAGDLVDLLRDRDPGPDHND